MSDCWLRWSVRLLLCPKQCYQDGSKLLTAGTVHHCGQDCWRSNMERCVWHWLELCTWWKWGFRNMEFHNSPKAYKLQGAPSRTFCLEVIYEWNSRQINSDSVRQRHYSGVCEQYGRTVCELTALAEAIWATALENSIELVAKHMPGVSNTAADRLSRIPIQYEWMIHPVIFCQLDSMWGPHTIYGFASMSKTQLPCYNGRFLDPATRGVNALAQTDWACKNNYVNPPFRLINSWMWWYPKEPKLLS